MKHLLILPAIAGALLMTSCELEEQIEPAEETYTKAFIKEFGVIDPKQDWNMATRGSVTVNTESPTDVSVYALNSEGYRLLDEFSNVSGTKNIQFDIPRGVNDILVSNGSTAVKTTVGGNVTLLKAAATRATHEATASDNTYGIAIKKTGDYKYFYENDKDKKTGVFEYRDRLPEGECNLNKVTQNFSFISDGKPFVIYPVYWQTNAVPEYGIAMKDAKGDKVHVPVYTVKSGDELQYSDKSENNLISSKTLGTSDYASSLQSYFADWDNIKDVNISDYTDEQKATVLEALKEADGSVFSSWFGDYHEFKITGGVIKIILVDWKNAEAKASADESKTDCSYRSLGIQITVPENTEFCFYCKNGDKIMYSEQDWNDDDYRYDADGEGKADTNDSSRKGVHGATFLNNEGTRCIAFEDWHNSSNGDVDLNDGVFYTTLASGDESWKLVDHDAQGWILAAEDLGNLDDFDFNDMVIKVTKRKTTTTQGSTTSGTTFTATYALEIEALAAGGTLPLKLCRTNSNSTGGYDVLSSPIEGLDATAAQQFHAWFGNGTISTGTMINTYSCNTTGQKITYTLNEEEYNNFSMTSLSTDVNQKMGGFFFLVEREDNDEYYKANKITAPKYGEAPQMICVPDTWKWPTERTNISKAYTGFGTWGANYENTDWLGTGVTGKILP